MTQCISDVSKKCAEIQLPSPDMDISYFYNNFKRKKHDNLGVKKTNGCKYFLTAINKSLLHLKKKIKF